MRYCLLDCEDAAKWAGHEQVREGGATGLPHAADGGVPPAHPGPGSVLGGPVLGRHGAPTPLGVHEAPPPAHPCPLHARQLSHALLHPGASWEHYRCFAGQLPPLEGLAERCDGCVITGSHYSVYEGKRQESIRGCPARMDWCALASGNAMQLRALAR